MSLCMGTRSVHRMREGIGTRVVEGNEEENRRGGDGRRRATVSRVRSKSEIRWKREEGAEVVAGGGMGEIGRKCRG